MSYNVSGARRSAAEGLQQCYAKHFCVNAQNVSRFFCTRKKSGPRSEHASDEACTGCYMEFGFYTLIDGKKIKIMIILTRNFEST